MAELSGGNEVYRDMAVKLWLETWLHQVPCDNAPGWGGAILRGLNPTIGSTIPGVPENRKHLHYDSTAIARCDLWFVVNHIFASKQLLKLKALEAIL